MRISKTALLALLLCGCVPLEPGSLPERPGFSRPSFGDLDPGAKTVTSLHFEVRAYGSDRAQAVSDLAERSYERIMRDTGLYSFMPKGLYLLVVYAGQDEFARKTGMPSWSAGAASGNSIFSFEGRHLPGVLSHEMTHLVFNEYMGRQTPEQRWVNEGLAVYEESRAFSDQPPAMPPGRRAIPFSQMVSMAPLGEERSMVDAWYAQVSSVVYFMIERGGRVGFGQFLASLRDGQSVDEAVRGGFPGLWSGFAALESAWLGSNP
ncbi:MAG: hypothetical protein HY922_10650 [Elusimicrobia bacterium]|nr:hypothetical protein [Elusimicrobiota bacterium]